MKKLLLLFVIFTFSCETEPTNVDVLISGGMIHDGTGINGYIGNVAINNDTIYYQKLGLHAVSGQVEQKNILLLNMDLFQVCFCFPF